MADQKIYIFALAATGKGISGSDRIFIEFAKHWSKNYPIKIIVWEEGYEMCLRHKLQIPNVKFQIANMKIWTKMGSLVNYLSRIIEGTRLGITTKVENNSNIIIYSASEFWMDSLPTFILKLRYPKIKWVASCYQTAPNPFAGFTEGHTSRYRLNALIYWLIQFPIRPIIDNFANYVLVNNDLEKRGFKKLDNKNKVLIVMGAIDLEKIKKWQKKLSRLPKKYDAVFQGRFHPQKGVLELIDIWSKLVKKKPKAKLIMIGDGPLMENVKLKIKNEKLEKNIKLIGYQFDGEDKYRIFAQSKVVVHPAFYDSGGMASYEAMAFGLPVVGFNLASYKYYFPKGMIKAKIEDLNDFANKILQLLIDKKLYVKVKNEVREFINDKLSWKYRSRQILTRVLE